VPDDDLARKVWHRRVDRAKRSQPRERGYADAARAFLAVVADEADRAASGPGNWGPAAFFERPPNETEARAMREYLDRVGEISGAGPYPA
jgi:hypothetical protein